MPAFLAQLDEDAVASRVPEAVVDHLEQVDVEEQDRDAPLGAQPSGQRLLDAVGEQNAVRQPRQRIVEGLVLVLA